MNLKSTLDTKDLVIGTVIALAMIMAFIRLSSGLSLIVTFVPGMVMTWLTFGWLYATKTTLPSGSEFLPLFFTTLAVQFIHFAEEYLTGFRVKFPLLYGGSPFTDDLFVTFNMISYFVFALSCILVFTQNLRFLLVPVLFFVIYGAIGNAISHTWWSLSLRAYFPGLVTAQVYWVLGPLALYKLVGRRQVVVTIILLFGLALMTLLTVFASPDAIGFG